MLTSLHIKTYSNSFSLTEICPVRAGNALQLKIPEDGLLQLKLTEDILKKNPSLEQFPILQGSLYTINGIQPDVQTGNFFILGSTCTSVIDATDGSDPQLSTSSDITIFDGCHPCNNCATLAQLQEDIQNCQIWINGLKDCNLYREPAASRLWNQMLDKKPLQAAVCKLNSDIVSNRQRDFGKAIKLLYQYKAVVAMWNYLVRAKAGTTEILTAPQDYGGFIVQSKRNIDSCGKDSAGNPTFHITITLQFGQVPSWLDQSSYGIGFYISKVDQNSYIQYGRDTGKVTGTREQNQANINMQVIRVEAEQDQIHIQILFTFTPTKIAASIFSASVKILPVIYERGKTYQREQGQSYTAPDALITYFSKNELYKWVACRMYATTVQEALQTQKNRWLVSTQWNISADQDPVIQDLYYHTAFSKHPEQESDSGSGSPTE